VARPLSDGLWIAAAAVLLAVAAGEVELAVGALDVTADREERVDFSHPFYRAGLGTAAQPQR